MKLLARGRAWVLPDEVDTDALAPTVHLHKPPSDYSKHCLEVIRPELASSVREGDVIVAGRDFGRGSSREHAAIALKYLGIRGVVAVSIAPIMKRNLFNIGIPAFEHPDILRSVDDGDMVELSTSSLKDLDKGIEVALRDLPHFMLDLINTGGLFNMVRKKGGISSRSRPLEERTEVQEVGPTKIYPAYEKYVDIVVERLERGEVLCGPFDTTYGLFASIKRPDAVKKVYEIKKRKENMPLTMVVPKSRFGQYAEISERVKKLLDTELVGPISIILPKKPDKVPDYVTSGLKTVSLADGDNLFMKRVMERVEICGTSANIHGCPPPSTLSAALRQLGDTITLAVDGGPSHYRIGHTVLDLSVVPPKLIRTGPYSQKKLLMLFPEMETDEEGLPEELVRGHSVIELSPEVEIKASTKGH